MKTIIKIKTWSCPQCDYHQDFEPTPELMRLHLQRNDSNCPNCKTVPLTPETRPEKKAVITIMGEDELDTHEIPDGKDKTRKLTPEEKEVMRAKIQADIIKFRGME